MRTADATMTVDVFRAPDASIGDFTLRGVPMVIGASLERMREISGYDIYGVVGMDFLKDYAVTIDYESGQLTFASAHCNAVGKGIPLDQDGAQFFVQVAIPGWRTERFLLDTGAQVSSLEPRLFDELAQRGILRKKGRGFVDTPVGSDVVSWGELGRISVGDVSLENMAVIRLPPSRLGREYLSRFVSTLDFPEAALYLKKVKNDNAPWPIPVLGFHCEWRDGKLRVDSVLKNSPEADAGIRPGDVVLDVEGVRTERSALPAIRRFLRESKRKSILVTVQRGKAELAVTLGLQR